MKTWSGLALAVVFLGATVVQPALAKDASIGGMQLQPGYKHTPLQGIDSLVGEIKKEGGLTIMYEIGSLPKPGGLQLGGQFSDRPKLAPKETLRWYREQTMNGQPVHLAHRKDDYLMVSFPQKGMNLSVKVETPEEMAEALLMILTYPNPVAEEKKATPEKQSR